jgi:probable F420-dependent oxidoreductase
MSVALGKVGVWAMELRFGDPGFMRDAAAELEAAGYGAVWLPGGVGGDILDSMSRLLDATQQIGVASGIYNIWKHEPKEAGDWWRSLSAAHQKRAMLGIGISHGPLIGEGYGAPLANMRAYLDKLDAEQIPRDHMCIGALRQKMLELSRDRTAGAHPYFMPPAHTARARGVLGPNAVLAPEQKVILSADAAKAREIARKAMAIYVGLPNYVNAWLSLGYAEEDVRNMSDHVIDALFAWGDLDQIKARVDAHHAAGADHVCLQVLGESGDGLRRAWRDLAGALI